MRAIGYAREKEWEQQPTPPTPPPPEWRTEVRPDGQVYEVLCIDNRKAHPDPQAICDRARIFSLLYQK